MRGKFRRVGLEDGFLLTVSGSAAGLAEDAKRE